MYVYVPKNSKTVFSFIIKTYTKHFHPRKTSPKQFLQQGRGTFCNTQLLSKKLALFADKNLLFGSKLHWVGWEMREQILFIRVRGEAKIPLSLLLFLSCDGAGVGHD